MHLKISKPNSFSLNRNANMSILKDYAINLATKKNLCSFLCYFSVDTWKRIEFVRNHLGLKIYETTITQNLLYDLMLCSEIYGFSVTMYEADYERTNGSDIELYIQTREGFIFAPTQAKIINSQYKYSSMEHRNQINDLIKYANDKDKRGFPLYLLYNYYPKNDFNVYGHLCGIQKTKELYGCSLISADFLNDQFAFQRIDRNGNRKWKIPEFIEIHPDIALPLFALGCCMPNKHFNDAIGNFFPKGFNPTNPKNGYKIYQLDEIIKESNWLPISSKRIHKDTKDNTKGFNPRFRIILSENSIILK